MSPHHAKHRLAKVRSFASLPLRSLFAILAVAGFVAVPLVGPHPGAAAWYQPAPQASDSVVATGAGFGVEREGVSVTAGWGSLPAYGRGDPGGAQAIAFDLVSGNGWEEGEFRCLVALWSRESGWNHLAQNPSSGAYGIPQSLPGNKMASAGSDWATNPETQIRWGLGYISARYGSPCGAWEHSEQRGWY
jgi:hypothetical protein